MLCTSIKLFCYSPSVLLYSFANQPFNAWHFADLSWCFPLVDTYEIMWHSRIGERSALSRVQKLPRTSIDTTFLSGKLSNTFLKTTSYLLIHIYDIQNFCRGYKLQEKGLMGGTGWSQNDYSNYIQHLKLLRHKFLHLRSQQTYIA